MEKFWIKYCLMTCTKHFDLSSSLTASCVVRFMICWVCRLYFSGLVCLVLSLDECLINLNYGRFRVAPIFLRFFYERWLSFLFGGLVAVNLGVNIVVRYAWIGSFDVRSLNSCKCVARWILCHYWLLKEIVWLFRG